MIIKRVAIQGFKTYAKRTDFIFDPGVTAVVGPNGSGKSNVADAIRWCLGEQSFSLLRSKKTSDVIFSGSDRKSRLGMAQVTVTLDNSEGELPVDFTEVEITRRAYRDGNNEYLLNGQRVRLQDITEILAPTGLGKRTYALIGQGLIERVLSMTPEDLRALFEEAAGITTQQTKRLHALRRLETAQANLTRVKDIVAEISPRLGYLQRQAERAEQRNDIADQLRELLEDWYGYHWHRALRERGTRKHEASELESVVREHRTALVALSEQIEKQRSEQIDLRVKLSELHRLSAAYHRDSDQIGRELAVAQERLRQVLARAESTRQELSPMRLERETLVERIAGSESKLEALGKDAAERRARVDALHETIAERQESLRQLEAEVERLRQEATELRTETTQTRSRHQQLDGRLCELAAELDVVVLEQQAAATQTASLSAELDSRRAELRDIEAGLRTGLSQREDLAGSLAEMREALDDALQRRQQADREVDRLHTRFDVLNRLRREGAGYANGVRSVLQQSEAGKLDGIIGTIATVLDVPANLDKAIETALGGAYQNIVTRSWAAAQRSIEYLNSSGNGRATFLPLDRLHMLPAIPAPKLPGILGNAANLVGFDAQVADAVQQLLNRVWVADNLDSARRSLDRIGEGPRPTVVTLGGEIIRPGGAVSGGLDRERRDESVLSREREFRELPARIAVAARSADQIVAEYSAAVAEIERHQQQLQSLQAEMDEFARQERAKQSEIAGLEKELERATQAAEWYASRAHTIREEQSSSAAQQSALSDQLEQCALRMQAAEAELGQAEESAKAGRLDALQQRLADLRTLAAEIQGSLQSQTAILESQRRSLSSIESQIANREAQATSLTDESAALQETIAELRRQEEEIGARIASVLATLRPAEETLHRSEVEQTRLETEERTLQATLRADEATWNAAQLAMQRAEDVVARLQRDIEQEFGLVFFDAGDEDAEQPPLPWDTIVDRLQPLESLPEQIDDDVNAMRRRLLRLKNVNPDAPREYAEASERCTFLETQAADLEEAIADLHEVIAKLDVVMERELQEVFGAVSEQFVHYFQVLFDGGAAQLSLTNDAGIANAGIEIVARPPGKRPQSLALLSGGERTLTALALIFAILRVSPTPFCVLDEVDASLDEANVDRYRFVLEELSQETQFILITHNRRTLEGTNAIYGVTMGSDGTSRVISLKLEGERIVRGDQGARDPSSGAPSPEDGEDDIAKIEETVQL